MAMILGVILIIHQVLKKRDKIKNLKYVNILIVIGLLTPPELPETDARATVIPT